MKQLNQNILERVAKVEQFVNKHNKAEYFNQRYELYRIHCGVNLALDLALKDCNLLHEFNEHHNLVA